MTHNPEMEGFLLQGDFKERINDLKSQHRTFTLINADNVLEHVPDPMSLLQTMKEVCDEESIICITVPNDFSITQLKAHELGFIDGAFWVTKNTAEHFNYFTVSSLASLGEAAGLRVITAVADWPVDFFLFNPDSNYNKDKRLGHNCHVAQVLFENMLFARSLEDTVRLREAVASSGIGRCISMYFKKK